MKFKKIFIGLIIGFIVIFNAIIFSAIILKNKKIPGKLKLKTVKVNNLTITIPAFKKNKIEKQNGWEIHSFFARGMVFRVSIAKGNKATLLKIVTHDLNLKTPPANKKLCLLNLCLVKRLKENPQGFYFIKHKKGINKFAYTFSRNGTIYYIDFFTSIRLNNYKELFDNALLSIAIDDTPLFKDKKRVKDVLTGIEPECFLICEPALVLILSVSISISIFILLFFRLNTKNMGKLPDNLIVSGIIPVYSEENIDTIFRLFTKRQWFLTSIVIENNGIHIYYRKKEMIFLTKDEGVILLKNGKSIFGQFIEGEFEKTRMQYIPMSIKFCLCKTVNLRFYTKNAEKIMSFLKT